MVGFAWPAARYGVLLINQEMRCKVRIESLFCEPADSRAAVYERICAYFVCRGRLESMAQTNQSSCHMLPQSYLIIFSGPVEWRGLTTRTQATFSSYSKRRERSRQPTSKQCRLHHPHPTLQPQSDLINMATQDLKKENL